MLKRILAAAGLLGCCVGESFAIDAGELAGSYGYYNADAATQPTIAVSPRGDLAMAWAELSPDGTLDIRSEVSIAGGHGDQLPVNTTTAGSQEAPSIAIDATGDTVIVWRGPEGIFGRRVGVDGQMVSAEFQISVSPWDALPQVAMDAFGNFIVAWERFDRDVGTAQILARRYLADGTAPDAEFQVDGPAEGPVGNAAVAMGAWGEFVIAWEQAAPSQPDVFVKSFAADGTPDGAESLAGALPAQARTGPSVGMDAHGRFVVAWSNKDLGGSPSVQARQYLAGGTPIGNEITVNLDNASRWPDGPAVGMGPLGDFVVAWNSAFSGRFAKQQFAPDGTRVGREISDAHRPLPNVTAAMDVNGGAYVGSFDDYSGSPRVMRYAGREDIDLGVVVEDLADPISPGQSLQHRVTVTNHHPGRVETGIPEIDSAIGRVDTFVMSYVTGGMMSPHTSDPCFAWDVGSGILWFCDLVLPPGASITYMVDATVSEPGQFESQSFVSLTQNDSRTANDSAKETTTVSCSDGTQPGTIVISAAPASVAEGEPFAVELQRTGGACGAVSADYEFTSADVSIATGRVTWANGQDGAQTVGLATPQDDEYEEGETAQFSLMSARGGAVIGSPSTATIAVVNEDVPCEGGPGTIVVSGPVSVEEGESARVEVQRVGGNCGAVSVDYSTGAGPDNPWTGGTLYWANAQDGVRAVMVETTEDDIDENPQSFDFAARNPTGGAILGSPSTTTVTIIDDDDTPTITITPSEYVVTEGGGNKVTFQLSLSRRSERGVTMPFTLSGSASRSSDYNVIPSDTINFYTGTGAQLEVLYQNDSVDEPEETVVVTFGEPTNAVVSGSSVVSVKILDNDEVPSVSIYTADASTAEGTSKTVALRLSNPNAQVVTVPLLWSGSAAVGADFSAPSSVVIPANATWANVAIDALTDGLDEEQETAVLTLGTPVNATLGADTNFALSIIDADATPQVSFVQVGQVTREGANVTVPVTAQLSGASSREVKVLLSSSGSAARGTDWSMNGDWLVFPAGSRTATKTVQILNNGVIELDEQVTFSMGSPANAVLGGTTAHTVTIKDNDPEALGVRETVQGAGGP